MNMAMNHPLTVDEVESIAKDKLPKHIYEFYASGADEQYALARNRDAFKRLAIRPRVLRNVSQVDTSCNIFGRNLPLPIGLAPSAMQKLAGGEGELDAARASASMTLNMTLSSQSTSSLEEVEGARKEVQATLGLNAPPFWMQLYLYDAAEKSIDLIHRAEAAGYEALVLTVDTPVLGNRLSERKTAVVLPPGMSLPNLRHNTRTAANQTQPSVNRRLMNARTAAEAKDIIDTAGSMMHSSNLTWEGTIPFLRRVTKMKLILKGIMTPEDAELAVQHGADAIIVSNHGGRQLDATSATIEALPAIAAVVDKRIPVIVDGGIRTGTDVYKALALGADFVLVGRPILWGLAYNGADGIRTVMHILERELSRTMALAGVRKLEEVTQDSLGVVRRDEFGISKL